ncbi:MAG: type III pantothenate kinase [Thiobacillus sp.]|nr:type III pantothenate kinase [Thiobacillus sp.]
MTPRRLLLDAGNSRLKWALVEGARWLSQGQADYADLSGLSAVLTPGTRAYVASVTRDENAIRLRVCLEQANVPARWLSAGERFDDVENGYAQPAQLGVDRWMALIGARKRTQSACLVVSAGTAVTIDAMTATGRFIGGLIVPGKALMRGALQAGTARVGTGSGNWRDFPRSTEDAVESGLVAALAGAIAAQYARLAAQSAEAPRCLVSGGDAEWLLPHLAVPAEPAPALVLEGLDCVARKEDAV